MPVLTFDEVEYLRDSVWIKPEQIKCINAMVKKWHRVPVNLRSLPFIPHINEFDMANLSGEEAILLVGSWVDADQLNLIKHIISERKREDHRRLMQLLEVRAQEDGVVEERMKKYLPTQKPLAPE